MNINFPGRAQVTAQAGQRVVLVDTDEGAVAKALERINDSIKRVAKKKFKVAIPV